MAINLKAARINADLSKKQVCDALNIHPNTLDSYEAYRTSPDMDTAEMLCKLYSCELGDIKWSKD